MTTSPKRVVEALVPGFFEHPAAVLSIAPTPPQHVVEHLVGRIDDAVNAPPGDVVSLDAEREQLRQALQEPS